MSEKWFTRIQIALLYILLTLAVIVKTDNSNLVRIIPATTDGIEFIYTEDGNIWEYDGLKQDGKCVVSFYTNNTEAVEDDIIFDIDYL